MTTTDLSSLNIDQLKKRKKFSSFMLGLLIGLEIIFIALLISSIISEEPAKGSASYYVFIPALVAVAIPLYIGVKKIDEEITRRESSKE